jgi:hypothetical protein
MSEEGEKPTVEPTAVPEVDEQKTAAEEAKKSVNVNINIF